MKQGERSRSTVHRVLSGLALVGSLAAIGGTLARDDSMDVVRALSPVLLLVTVVLQLVYLAPQAFRYWLVLHDSGTESIGFREWVPVFVIGRMLNTVAPQAGNVYRGVILKREHGIAYADYLGAFVAFTWLTTVLNAVTAAAVLLVAERALEFGGLPAWLLMALAAVVLTAAPFVLAAVLGLWSPSRDRVRWAHGRVARMLSVVTDVVRRGSFLARFTVAGLIGLGVATAIFRLAAATLDINLSFGSVVVLYVLLQLSTYVNLTPGNLGVQELGFGLVATQLGLTLSDGILIGVVVRVTGFLALVIAGLALGGVGTWRSAMNARGDPAAS